MGCNLHVRSFGPAPTGRDDIDMINKLAVELTDVYQCDHTRD